MNWHAVRNKKAAAPKKDVEAAPISHHVARYYMTGSKRPVATFRYLIDQTKPGHDLASGEALTVFNHGFEDIEKELKSCLRDISYGKKLGYYAKNVDLFASSIRIDLTHSVDLYQDSKEIFDRIVAKNPNLRMCAVIHEKREDGSKGWHMHLIRLALPKCPKSLSEGMSRWNARHVREKLRDLCDRGRLDLFDDIPKIIAAVYAKKGIKTRDSRGRQIKKKDSEALAKAALNDAVRCGETNLRAGQKKRTQSAAWLTKVAENRLEGDDFTSPRLRKAAALKAEHAQVNVINRKRKRPVKIDEDTEAFQSVLLASMNAQDKAAKTTPAPASKVSVDVKMTRRERILAAKATGPVVGSPAKDESSLQDQLVAALDNRPSVTNKIDTVASVPASASTASNPPTARVSPSKTVAGASSTIKPLQLSDILKEKASTSPSSAPASPAPTKRFPFKKK